MENHRLTFKVAFVANFQLTPTFLLIANEMTKKWGYEIHWLVFSKRWYKWLRNNNVPEAQIVKLFDSLTGEGQKFPSYHVEDQEPPLEDLLRSDRVLSNLSQDNAKDLLARILSKAKTEIQTRDIHLLFGEQTWAVEVMINYVARTMGVKYLSPVSTRIPSNRIAFSDSPIQSKLIDFQPGNNAEQDTTDEILNSFFDTSKQQLWAYNQFKVSKYIKMPKLVSRKIIDAIFDSRGNPTQRNLSSYFRFKNPIKLAQNTKKLDQFFNQHGLLSPEQLTKPYVLITLHVQPEASIDVMGWKYRNQQKTIFELRENLDPEVLLAVKEHSHVFGARPFSFFHELLSNPGIVFVHPNANTRKWLEQAHCVMSPTGTSSLEKGLLGGPSAVFSPIWFSKLETISVIDPSNRNQIQQILTNSSYGSGLDCSQKYLSWVISRSMEAKYGTLDLFPDVASPENLDKLSNGFHLVSLSSIGLHD